SMPDAAYETFRLQLLAGDREGAATTAVHVARFLEAAQRNGGLSAASFRLWVEAEKVLGNSSRLERIVDDWESQHPNDLLAQTEKRDQKIKRWRELLAARRPDPDALAALTVELANDPHSGVSWQDAAGRLWAAAETTPNALVAIDRLMEYDVTSLMLEYLAARVAKAGHAERAEALFRHAIASEPRRAVLWNNLAWVLLHRDLPDLTAAHDASMRACELAPNEPRFRETRGQIYLKLEQWPQAIADLEYAVGQMPDYREGRLSLARAYDAVGELEKAAEQRRLARD
ncbi:MAG: hypothetical protein KDA61_16265, partial [Planctomycetales bacterium]|nr:hypothetical protein [Planctomycetales bacterium]